MLHRFVSNFRRVSYVLLAVVAVFSIASNAQAQNLAFTPGIASTYAGDVTGANDESAVNYVGPLSGLVMDGPGDITYDSAGNLYIVEVLGKIIRVVAASSTPIPALPGVAVQAGFVYTVAGVGAARTAKVCATATNPTDGDGCPATQAKLGSPRFIAVDAHGNIFIPNFQAPNDIRVIYAGGTVPGLTSPQPGFIYPVASDAFGEPFGIAVDAQENIYYSTQDGSIPLSVIYSGQTAQGNPLGIPDGTPAGTIVNLGNGLCTYTASNTCGDGGPIAQAGFGFGSSISGLAVDPSGNIYIADAGNNRLRVIYVAGKVAGLASPTPGNIYTVAGGGTSSSIPPAGESATNAALQPMNGVSFDALGDLYIAAGNVVYRVDASGIITTVFGGAANCAASSDAWGDGCPATSAIVNTAFAVATDAGGNIYVSDNGSGVNLIRESTVSSSALIFTGTAGFPLANDIVIVSNTGSQPLQLSGFSFNGPFAQVSTGGTTDCASLTTLAPGQSCPIAVTLTNSAVGSNSGSLTVSSNSLNASGGSNTVALSSSIAAATTATSLAVSPAFPTIVNTGQQATFTIVVTPPIGDSVVPTGSVNLLNGSTQVGTGTLTNGVATIQSTDLPTGSLQITAQYGGDENFDGSTSFPVPVSVASASLPVAEVSLAASATTATSGQSVTLTATVATSGGAVVTSGTVTFQDGNNPIGAPVTVNGSGIATLNTSTLPAGVNTLVAVFNGAGNFAANTSSSVTVNVSGGGQLAFSPAIINKIAGVYPTIENGSYDQPAQGYSGDDISAVDAEFDFPEAAVADSFGNVYIADSQNNLIRVVASGMGSIPGVPNAQAGNIYTFAGSGTCSPAPCGDGGQALQAALSGPNSLAVDIFGNVYFTDDNQNGLATVRKINTQGIIQTVAGNASLGLGYSGDNGPATSAQIHAVGVTVDNSGNLYIADGGNDLIRRVDALTGIITTVVGSTNGAGQQDNFGNPLNGCATAPCGDGGLATDAFLHTPTGVAIDASENLYIADSGDQVIRRVDAKTGIISTIAGSFEGDFGGDGGPATSASLNGPVSVTVDNAGDLYIFDQNNFRVREVNAQTGIINTIVGGGTCTPAPCGDGGFATSAQIGSNTSFLSMDSQGDLYLVDHSFGTVREVPVITTELNFGTPNLGTNNTQTFTVTNIGAQPLSLTGVDVATTSPLPPPTPSDFIQQPSGNTDCAASMQLAPSLSCAIDVQWFPTIAQPETAIVTVASNATNSTGGNNVISLSGSGVGSNGMTAQTITFPPLQASYPYETAIALTATTTATGQTVTYRIIGPATLNGVTVTPTGIGTVTVTAYQFGNSQYASATSVSQTFTVTQAPLTVTASNLSLAVGTPVTQPTYVITGFVGSDNQASVVTGTPVLTINDPQTNAVIPIGATPADGAYPITITQGTLSAGPNYALNFVNGTLAVTGSQGQAITFTSLPNVTYGVTPITLNAVSIDAATNVNTGLPVTFTVTGPATVAGNLLNITGAGAVAVTANQTGGTNYAAASPVTESFTVAPAPLTVTAANLSVAQNAPLPDLTTDYKFSGFVNGDSTAAVSGTPTLTTTATDTATLGSSPINIAIGSLSSANYTFSSFVPGTLTVVAGTAQTISFPMVGPVIYGAAPIALSAKASSGLGVSYIVTSGPATVAGNMIAITGAGAVTVVANQPGGSNYSPATPVSQTITVAPAVLMLTANDATRVNDVPNPTFSYTLTGFVNGDTQGSATSGQPIFTTTATPSSPVGTYDIIPEASYTNNGGLQTVLSAANYTFTPVNGTLTITSGGPAAGFSLTATPQQLNILVGESAQAVITLNPANYYQALVTLSCGTLPANVQCTFSPATVSPDGTGAIQTTTLAITTNNATVVGSLNQKNDTGIQSAAIFYLPGALAGLLIMFYRRRLLKSFSMRRLVVLVVLLAGLSGLAACGTAVPSSAAGGATPGTYTVTVTAKGQDGAVSTVPISIQIR